MNAIKLKNPTIEKARVEEIINEIDYMGNGSINYTEFLAATLGVKSILTEERMKTLFRTFDVDYTGFISVQNLKIAFTRLGRGDQVLDDDEV